MARDETTPAYTLFPTAIGHCGLAWRERGIVRVQLPERDAAQTRQRLIERFPGAREQTPPPAIREVIAALVGLLRGDKCDLNFAALDLEGVAPFERRVYEIARGIPPGETLTYGELAAKLGTPGAARAVGRALGRNPFPLVVPCHRVLAAGGKDGGFSAYGGVATKRRLLAIEAAQIDRQSELFGPSSSADR